ncbi:hypothetical protein [Simkania sp.]|uniref:hypothetical protein n=1 Tax=Simkania sp. TaxID=34094 RepID=UPI003B52F1AC
MSLTATLIITPTNSPSREGRGLPLPNFSTTSPVKPVRHDDVLRTFIDQYNLPETVAKTILKSIYTAQQKLGPKGTQTVPPSAIFPNFIAIESSGFHIYAPSTDKGGNGSVFVGPFIATKRTIMGGDVFSPTKPKDVARKVSHRPTTTGSGYSPIKRKVDEIRAAVSPTKTPLIAPIYSTSTDRRGHKHMMMPAYPRNYAKINWVEIENPARYLIYKVGLVAYALAGLHRFGKVHRDVKEMNVMDDTLCKLIDFDTLCDTFEDVGFTTGTISYLNPRSFGSAEMTLINQKLRQGLQRPCDDMFALYHMGLIMTLRLCSQLISKSETETHELIRALTRSRIIRPPDERLAFKESELRHLGKKYPYRAHFYSGNQRASNPERVAVFPDAATCKSELAQITSKLPLSVAEQEHLLSFGIYCIDQKFQSDDARSDANSAYAEFTDLLESLQTSLTKRPRKRSASTDGLQEHKRTKREAVSLPVDLNHDSFLTVPEKKTV